MTTLVRITVALILSLFLSSCGFDIRFDGADGWASGKKGNGNVTKEKRKISDEFTEISASEGLKVYVTQANDFKIEVEADENVIDLIATDIKDGKLRIHARRNIGRATKNIYVSLPEVSALKGSSGSHLKTKSRIKADQLEIDGSSGALLVIEVNADDVEIDASSGANLSISGDTTNADVDASSGGNINAKDLESKVCDAEASSGGNVSIRVSESLVANASSGGNISYSGDPSVKSKKHLSGSITHRN